MHRPLCVALAAIVLVSLVPGSALAADRLGEPWEEGILQGIQRQEEERKEKRPEVILRQAEMLAARRGDAVSRVVRLYLLARAYGIAKDPRSAQATYREVLQLAPRCYFAYHDLGMLAVQQNPPDKKAAENLLRRATTAHPGFVMGHKKLVSLLLDLGRSEEAINVLKRLVTLEPAGLDTRFLLARSLLAANRLDEAEREIVVLLRKDPSNPAVLELKAALYTARGRLGDAKKTYRRLAEQNPTAVQPLRGYIRCLEAERAKDPTSIDPEEWLWVLERLYRVERDPAAKERLKEAIEEFRRLQSGETQPGQESDGPPPIETLIRVLDHAPPEGRVQVLQYVYARGEELEKVLLRALIRHLGPRVETSPQVRQWALRVLGRYGGTGVAGLIRHSLGDPDAGVRPVAVDALVSMSEMDVVARSTAVLVLGLYRDSRDALLAGHARYAVLDLTKGRLPDDLEDSEIARREAFQTWWVGPVATEGKIDALEEFPKVGDLFPEDVLLPYLLDSNPRVAEAAWKALERSVGPLRQGGKLTGARAEWFGRLPGYRAGALTGEGGDAARARLRAWTAARPGS